MREAPRGVMERRLRRAVALVVAVLALVAASGVVEHAMRPSVASEAASAFGASDASISEVLGQGEEENAALLPASFHAEVGMDAEVASVRVDDAAKIVSYVAAGSADQVFEDVCRRLEGKGWHAVESGLATCGSFAKEEGVYRWLFVACLDVADGTSVVLQYQTDEE
ncbi:hypothetical protein GMI69_04080 [Eggerthellaceae bacterium zg-887]|uniref:hypothetical protein n=1 Tax=Xiamenia xianingshaonis TaxID=2682776 RepID=UPI00140BE2EC|nr:hypothetical protein [Xiamenia xianingshaonis]NHM15851.1 hypothetical protein [Xiamenia xianingshaonis]